MAIEFNFPEKVTLKDRQLLKSFIESLFKKERKKPDSISFVFCSDAYILEINKSFLNHHYYTDIITFELSDPGAAIVDAEIYISVDTVRDNAKIFKTSITQELHRVIFHGILHLCGYKDKTGVDKKLMTQKEDQYLIQYFKGST